MKKAEQLKLALQPFEGCPSLNLGFRRWKSPIRPPNNINTTTITNNKEEQQIMELQQEYSVQVKANPKSGGNPITTLQYPNSEGQITATDGTTVIHRPKPKPKPKIVVREATVSPSPASTLTPEVEGGSSIIRASDMLPITDAQPEMEEASPTPPKAVPPKKSIDKRLRVLEDSEPSITHRVNSESGAELAQKMAKRAKPSSEFLLAVESFPTSFPPGYTGQTALPLPTTAQQASELDDLVQSCEVIDPKTGKSQVAYPKNDIRNPATVERLFNGNLARLQYLEFQKFIPPDDERVQDLRFIVQSFKGAVQKKFTNGQGETMFKTVAYGSVPLSVGEEDMRSLSRPRIDARSYFVSKDYADRPSENERVPKPERFMYLPLESASSTVKASKPKTSVASTKKGTNL